MSIPEGSKTISSPPTQKPANLPGATPPLALHANGLHPRNWRFRTKLGLASLLLGLLPLLLGVTVVAQHADTLIDGNQNAAGRQQASVTAAVAGTIISSDILAMQKLASKPATLAALTAALRRHTPADPAKRAANQALGPLQSGTLYLASRAGAVVASTRASLVGHSPRGLPAVAQALTSGAPVAVLGTAVGSTNAALTVAVPVRRANTIVGAVVGEFDPSSLYDALGAGAEENTLVAADGRVIGSRTLPPGPPVLLVGGNPAAPSAQPAFAALQGDGQPVQLADGSWAAPVVPGAHIVLQTPIFPAAEKTLGNLWIKLFLAVLVAAAIAAALWITVEMTRPIIRLARTLVLVRTGDFSVRTGLRQRDEVGQIAIAVDLLIARTQKLVSDLDNQRVELENGIIQLFTELAEAASGDLTVRPTLSEGSLGAVADSVGILLERFNGTVKRIQSTADAVSYGTSQMAATITLVSQEAQNQAAQLTSGASAIAEVAASASAVSQRTHAATEVAAQAVEAVDSGNQAVIYARDAVKRTSETSKRAARQVKSLGESAQLMGNALLLVQHNTEELHLIAGNASIEAARYAENGGVFRTVADSIEHLAQQSQVALRQIQSVIENTQRETSRVVSAIEEVTIEVSTVAKAVNLAGENFDTINHVVQRLADLNIFIASASEQQAEMAADVAELIGNLNQGSVQTSRNTAASAEHAIQLRQLTEQLNDSVATLKVS